MKIYYSGKQNSRLDKTLEVILNLFQYEFIGSGYNFKKNERDLQFEIKERKVTEESKKKIERINQS